MLPNRVQKTARTGCEAVRAVEYLAPKGTLSKGESLGHDETLRECGDLVGHAHHIGARHNDGSGVFAAGFDLEAGLNLTGGVEDEGFGGFVSEVLDGEVATQVGRDLESALICGGFRAVAEDGEAVCRIALGCGELIGVAVVDGAGESGALVEEGVLLSASAPSCGKVSL